MLTGLSVHLKRSDGELHLTVAGRGVDPALCAQVSVDVAARWLNPDCAGECRCGRGCQDGETARAVAEAVTDALRRASSASAPVTMVVT